MDRRAYLTALGATAAAVSGCSEGNSTGTENDAPTATESTEPTPTPEPTPEVDDAGLLLDRGEYAGLDKAIDSVGQGGELIVGVDYRMPVSGGSVNGLVEVRVLDDAGERIDDNTSEVNAIDDGDSSSREAWFAFDTADWEQGSYTAEILVNSEAYGTTTSTEVPFEIVEPLGEGEVEMYINEFPDDAVAGEEFDWTLGFRNVSDRDSSIVTDTVLLDPARGDTALLDFPYRENIPAGGDITVSEEDIKISRGGTYSYRIEALDAEVSFTIGRAEE